MSKKISTVFVNYQERASEFRVGDSVVPYGQGTHLAGRVVAVWPAIGMVDVEYSHGSTRYPVEDLQRVRADSPVHEPLHESVPGGAGTVPVPNSAYPSVENRDELDAIPSDRAKAKKKQELEILSDRVATAHTKKALYWSAKGRQYKPCKRETASGEYECPKCGFVGLRKAIYKKIDGIGSVPLYGCPSCMFLIRRDDILD